MDESIIRGRWAGTCLVLIMESGWNEGLERKRLAEGILLASEQDNIMGGIPGLQEQSMIIANVYFVITTYNKSKWW